MALIQFGGGITSMRGSLAGNTFSRSKSGDYVRSRKKPVNPRSPLQNTRRAQMAYLARYWSHSLTPQERTDWRAYATGTSWTNKLAQAIEIGGNAAFLRLNTHIAVYGGTLRHAAPEAMGHAGGVTFTFAAESDTTKIQMDEPNGAFDKAVLGHYINFYQGIPTEIGRIATPKGFKYIGSVYGHDSAPLAFPYELDAAYTMAAGQFITIKAMFNDDTYRLSGPFFASDEAAAAA